MRFHRTVTVIAAATVALLGLSACSVGGDSPEKSSDILIFAGGETDHLTPGRQTVAFDQVMSTRSATAIESSFNTVDEAI